MLAMLYASLAGIHWANWPEAFDVQQVIKHRILLFLPVSDGSAWCTQVWTGLNLTHVQNLNISQIFQWYGGFQRIIGVPP